MKMDNNHTSPIQEKDACGVGFIYRPSAAHSVIRDALVALSNLEHRGAVGADGESGDGAGVLTAIPWQLLEEEGWAGKGVCAVGMMFLPAENAEFCRWIAEYFLKDDGFKPVGWRTVPICKDVLGQAARESAPVVEQVLINIPDGMSDDEAEKKLLAVRRKMTNYLWSQPFGTAFFVCSMSCRTIVYKAMVRSEALAKFYPDLENPLYESKFAVFHRRFSTNTTPKWWLAQPFRLLGHNGEINTLAGNRIWAHAREGIFEQAQLTSRNEPILHPSGSDSANLDNMLELMLAAGFSAEASLMRLIPASIDPVLDEPQVADFYEFHAAIQEPWDGPALIVYSDGHTVGAILDRNGLRPARFTRYADGSLILCSEAGVVKSRESEAVEKGRLGPGQMISVSLSTGHISYDQEIKLNVSSRYSYGQWLREERRDLSESVYPPVAKLTSIQLRKEQIASGYGREDLEHLAHMAATGHEPVWSMGDDAALPVLSRQPRILFDYFRQRFAQVTNPPIDSLRERLVMSLDTYLGSRWRGLIPHKECARVLKSTSPILSESQVDELRSGVDTFPTAVVSICAGNESFDIETELDRICEQAADAVIAGAAIVILSDRKSDDSQVAVPVLIAVGAVHHYLIARRLRLSCSLVADSSQVWNPHHYACLLGYGAQAVCPYLAWETVRQFEDGCASSAIERQLNYRKCIEDALLKIMAKMGISVLTSYIGAQLFEAIGLGKEMINRCFAGTPAHVGALNFTDLSRDTMRFADLASASEKVLDYGHLRHRADGEFHGNNPEVVKTLHRALGLRSDSSGNDGQGLFLDYSELVLKRPAAAIRDLITVRTDRKPVPVNEVEPAADIVKRFCTGGMSLGALSPEAHETLAIAMNRLGGRSNSGEGGEDPRRYRTIASGTVDGVNSAFPGLTGLRDGDRSGSAIRQVASGRFGVTAEYLVTAEQVEIKIAQGAKPGEGGQLPGHKVSEYIARLRRANPGTTLISPPPHHDIYSIEDLAQLIFDLRQVNSRAMISVKLVSSSGIGTIASGVAKANADVIQISGHEGGTGASPVSSIRHAGLPWEIGLAEVHQTLLANGLRARVLLRVDGGLRTGYDVVTAALLGAEEYGFGSIVLVAAGCIMARLCHTNNCPVGVATQLEKLREKFVGTPEQIENLLLFVAEEVRCVLAELGYRSLNEIIGRTGLLIPRQDQTLPKSANLDLEIVLKGENPGDRTFLERKTGPHLNPPVLDDVILADDDVRNAIAQQSLAIKSYAITNRDRATGAKVAGEIARTFGDEGFHGKLTLQFQGAAGQSFGAFNIKQVRLILTGEANDYVGKGMNGGTIVVRPNCEERIDSQSVIAGNACLYGATGGALYCAGRVGERFAVRNAGAFAVVEGVGDHGCEYMTGGAVVVIGEVGRNFGAGMTGGVCYVFDETGTFPLRLSNDGGTKVLPLTSRNESALKRLIGRHYKLTGSESARRLLEHWSDCLQYFWQVVPTTEQDKQNAANSAASSKDRKTGT